jgi:beta-barrel assembly-enhancing protease
LGNQTVRKLSLRLIIGLLFAIFGLINYFGSGVENPITGEVQRVQLSPRQEVALGLQAREEMAAQHGNLFPDEVLQAYVDQVGDRIVQRSAAARSGYPFEFHLLRDPQTINAFALPGGQIFITAALMNRLSSEAQLAGVLGHEVGHVVARHGAEHLAKQQLGIALVNAVGIAASDSPDAAQQAAVLAQAVNQMVSLKYGREDELESDQLGFRFMVEAGYNPTGIVETMRVLASARSGDQPPEFLSTHPDPANRAILLERMVKEGFPNGVPPQLESGQTQFEQALRRLR